MILTIPWLVHLKARLAGLPPDDAAATTIGPFIIVADEGKVDRSVLNHERIHIAQWRELWWVGFPVVFWALWLWGMVREKGDVSLAYLHNPLEREANRFMDDFAYLERRERFAWTML